MSRESGIERVTARIYGPNPSDRAAPVVNLPEYYEDQFPKALIDDLIRGKDQHVDIEFKGKRIIAVRLASGQYAVAYGGGGGVKATLPERVYVVRTDRLARIFALIGLFVATAATVNSVRTTEAVHVRAQQAIPAEADIRQRLECLNRRLDALKQQEGSSEDIQTDGTKIASTRDRRRDMALLIDAVNVLSEQNAKLKERMAGVAMWRGKDCPGATP